MSFKDINTNTVLVNGGEKISAGSSGMLEKQVLDVALEEQQWEGLTKTSDTTNWGLIIRIIFAGVAFLGIILLFAMRKRKLNQAR